MTSFLRNNIFLMLDEESEESDGEGGVVRMSNSKRNEHNVSERRRRDNIRNGFDILQGKDPPSIFPTRSRFVYVLQEVSRMLI